MHWFFLYCFAVSQTGECRLFRSDSFFSQLKYHLLLHYFWPSCSLVKVNWWFRSILISTSKLLMKVNSDQMFCADWKVAGVMFHILTSKLNGKSRKCLLGAIKWLLISSSSWMEMSIAFVTECRSANPPFDQCIDVSISFSFSSIYEVRLNCLLLYAWLNLIIESCWMNLVKNWSR